MPRRSLIEYKLRLYFNTGHEYSMYIPPSMRNSFWAKNPRHLPNFTGVRLIGKIVKRKKIEEINSIVPIILKVKKENKLLDEQHLIFALAVCAKFNFKHCVKMVSDAYKAVSLVCTDGSQLLMFANFVRIVGVILRKDGYTHHIPSGFGNGFRKAIKNWYLNRDPLVTTEMIVKDTHFNGLGHRDLMKLIHIHSDDPARKIFICHTLDGMKKVEKLFGSQYDVPINDNESFEEFQLKFLYSFLKKINNLKKMEETKLVTEIELERWGHNYKVIPTNKRKRPAVISALVVHMPLRDVLNNTHFFAKQKLFSPNMQHMGLLLFKSCFNNTVLLRKQNIHPIESFIEFVKYSRTFKKILEMQNNSLKKKGNYKYTLDEHRFKFFLKEFKRSNDISSSQIIDTQFEEKNCTIQLNSTDDTLLPWEFGFKLNSIKNGKNKSKHDKILKQTLKLAEPIIKDKNKPLVDTTDQLSNLNIGVEQNNFKSISKTAEIHLQSNQNTQINQTESNRMVLLKPPPKIIDSLEDFLSKDLFKKTLKLLEPTGQRILIAYDNRKFMKKYMCMGVKLLRVHEAITLITISLIVPEKTENKPTIICIDNDFQKDNIEIGYDNILSFTELDKILFKESFTEWDPDYKKKNIPDVKSHLVLDWARKNKKEYDVIVFLGTNKINYRNIKRYIREYQKFVQKPVKIISCCFNGKHSEQRNLSRGNMLFISGFDKNIGKVIHKFIKGEF